jgi:hypothetical protein
VIEISMGALFGGRQVNQWPPSVAILKTIGQFATYSSLSHALDYRDSNAPPIKFQFLLGFKVVVRFRWIANNAGEHHATPLGALAPTVQFSLYRSRKTWIAQFIAS